MARKRASSRQHLRATVFLIPALFAPTSPLRAGFHRMRGVHIGGGAEIGYDVLIDNLYPERVYIGKRATVAARSVILAHDEARAYAWGGQEVVKTTRVGDGAFIGVGSVILPGVTVGEAAIVGAGSLVNRDVPPNTIVAGVPAREIGKRAKGVQSLTPP